MSKPRGLQPIYAVSKADGFPTDPRAIYFVLRLDSFGRDPKHLAACRAAARAYADCVDDVPHLAPIGKDLRTLLDGLELCES